MCSSQNGLRCPMERMTYRVKREVKCLWRRVGETLVLEKGVEEDRRNLKGLSCPFKSVLYKGGVYI